MRGQLMDHQEVVFVYFIEDKTRYYLWLEIDISELCSV